VNLTQALNAALPEIPARRLAEQYPRLPPDAVFKEHVESGQPVVRVLVPSQDAVYRFAPQNWALARSFDGQRSFEDVANIHFRETGNRYDVVEVREFAAALEEMGFWYKTPLEKNVLLMQKSYEERQKILKSKKNKWGDLSQILFPAVNPDRFLTRLHHYTAFVYTKWFTLTTLAAFAVMVGITVTHWSEVGRDSLQFFNFTEKSWGDVAIFYVLAVLTMGWHEIGHGHACKHYGGRVPSMGFLLIYLTPAFYTDTSEGYIKGSRIQRLIISLAGVWSELMICAVATVIWWGTTSGTVVHEASYFVMLITGLASVLINWNPLMKLDGYHMLCEILDVPELKENSTAYVSAWVKRNVWRLPVEVPYVPRKRRPGYAAYALLSGLYSYTVLFVLARFVGNVFRNFNPDWSFVPEIATAGVIFRSRIRTLVNFMKFVYLDKKDRVRAWFGRRQTITAGVFLLVILLLPIWPESTPGTFTLEPTARAVIRNPVAGTVTKVYVKEGMQVSAGSPLIRLRNLKLASRLAKSETAYTLASMRVNSATLQHRDIGPALQVRDQLERQTLEMRSKAGNLALKSPISGRVLTPRMDDLTGASLPEGAEVAEVADLSRMRARLYIPEAELYKVRIGASVRLEIGGFFKKWSGRVDSIAPLPSEVNPMIANPTKYKGLQFSSFYAVDVTIPNVNGELAPGMNGVAKIEYRHRSFLGLAVNRCVRFFARKLW
jgi:putative peptide zinc metalloprotease protein